MELNALKSNIIEINQFRNST